MGRNFLLGIALGIVIGLYAAPMVGRPSIGPSEMSQVFSTLGTSAERVPDKLHGQRATVRRQNYFVYQIGI